MYKSTNTDTQKSLPGLVDKDVDHIIENKFSKKLGVESRQLVFIMDMYICVYV